MTALGVVFIFIILAIGYASYRRDSRIRQAIAEHDRCVLAGQRIAYIAKLRNTLRKCEALYGCDYTVAGKALMQEIRNLTTAVDINGKPLEKTDASNT